MVGKEKQFAAISQQLMQLIIILSYLIHLS